MHKYIDKYEKTINTLKIVFLFSAVYLIFFSPVVLSDRLLAPGDAITQSVPAFYSPRILWTDLLYSGFPTAADPTVQHWYPVSILCSLIPNSWNCFALSAYVIASCFTYGYIYKLTSSKFAAACGGLIYGMSGFMMAHLGHVSMVHSAAWMPLIIWSLEELRAKFTIQWFLVACLAIACSILAGHPQISVYSFTLAALYVLFVGWKATIGRWYYYKLFLAIASIGIALSAIQIIPTAELSSFGLRPDMSFEEFNSFSLPPVEAIKLIFPYALGASHPVPGLYSTPYFGSGNFTELAGYAGITTLLLALVGLIYHQHRTIAKFWGFAALVCFLLTLGEVTPLSRIVYHLPILNNFRAPARHFNEITFAFSVLAGMGLAGIIRQLPDRKQLLKIITYSAGFLSVLLIVIFLSKDTIIGEIQEKVGQEAAEQYTLLPWSNLTLGLPLLIFLTAIVILLYLVRFPGSKITKYLIFFWLIFDLGSFGWFCEWQYSPSSSLLEPTPRVQQYAQTLNFNHQRILPIRGGYGSWEEIPVNMSRLWQVPSATGYGPLILSRVSQLLSIGTGGDVLESKFHLTRDRSLDIMAVRYLTTPQDLAEISYQDLENQSDSGAKDELAFDDSRWQLVENIDRAKVYENLRAQPRAWLVPEAIKLEPVQILKAIKSSNLPDGRTYEPAKIALVEENVSFNTENFDSQATAKFSKIDDTHLQFETKSNSPAFLILSDINYPGWRAKINGKTTRIFQTNYVLRGIVLPQGNSTVEFIFKPTSLNLGVGITATALSLCMYLFGFYLKRKSAI